MTDKDIIKALNCCTSKSISCQKCPLLTKSKCERELIRHSFDLIKRQQVEIEKARAEAIKEFVDRILSYIDVGHLRPPTEICFSDLDVRQIVEKIANEMVDAENET